MNTRVSKYALRLNHIAINSTHNLSEGGYLCNYGETEMMR